MLKRHPALRGPSVCVDCGRSDDEEDVDLNAEVHISNANLADRNEGLNNAGVRVGYRF